MRIKSLLTWILASLTLCSSASAAPALSYIAFCHASWPCRASLSAFDGQEVVRTGWLMNTFNRECPCAERLLTDPRPKVVRIHIANSTCFKERGRVCGKYEVFHGYSIAGADTAVRRRDPKVINRFRRVLARTKALLDGREKLMCYVSPCLECSLSRASRRVLLQETKNALPGCVLVDNPVSGKCLSGAYCEKHGPKPGLRNPCIADLDGIDFRRVSVSTYLQHTQTCDASFIWGAELNCLPKSGGFVDPRKRLCLANRAFFAELGRYLRPEPKFLTGVKLWLAKALVRSPLMTMH